MVADDILLSAPGNGIPNSIPIPRRLTIFKKFQNKESLSIIDLGDLKDLEHDLGVLVIQGLSILSFICQSRNLSVWQESPNLTHIYTDTERYIYSTRESHDIAITMSRSSRAEALS